MELGARARARPGRCPSDTQHFHPHPHPHPRPRPSPRPPPRPPFTLPTLPPFLQVNFSINGDEFWQILSNVAEDPETFMKEGGTLAVGQSMTRDQSDELFEAMDMDQTGLLSLRQVRTHPPTHPLSLSLMYSVTRLLGYSVTRLLGYSVTRLLGYSVTRSRMPSPARALTHACTFSLHSTPLHSTHSTL